MPRPGLQGEDSRDGEGAAAEAPDGEAMRAAASLVAERGDAALGAGIEPDSAQAEPIVAEIVRAFGELDTPAVRAQLADRFEQGADPRAERYWQLLAVINGWSPVPSTVEAWNWTIRALRG